VWRSGQTLLASIGFPFQVDADVIAAAYPWLPSHTQPGCLPSKGEAADGPTSATAPA